jgi:predicted RNA binding protein YcfA (HicA-like mRNA interferase family)
MDEEFDFRHIRATIRLQSECSKFREVIRLIEDDGWQLVAQRGSHRQYGHPTKPGRVTVAGKSNADVPKGTAANILRQAGLRRSGR